MMPNESSLAAALTNDPRVERKLGDPLLAQIVAETLGAEAQRVLTLEVEGGGE